MRLKNMRTPVMNMISILLVAGIISSASCGTPYISEEVAEPRSSSSVSEGKSSLSHILKSNEPPIDARRLIRSVADRHTKLKYYRSKGLSQHRSIFDGDHRVQPDTHFEVEYVRGQKASISWKENEHAYVFRVQGKKSWLEIDGEPEKSYSSAGEGLMSISMAEGGRFRFGIDTFVFRDELQMGNLFFGALVDPQVIGEEDVDQRPCYVLSGTFTPAEGHLRYWIDTESSVIRKIEKVIIFRKVFEGKEYVTTTTTTETYSDIEIR
jgi:hypothetical protein